MKTRVTTALAVATLTGACAFSSAQPPMTTVAPVDIDRYTGQWHEIARLPMPYQDHCASDTTATYRRNENGTITVINRCRQADGTWSQAEGLARSTTPDNSRLSVTFLPKAVRWLPVGRADYWIMALGDDYRHALIGQPSRKYLWLLSRKPTMDEALVQRYLQQAREQGYDLSTLLRTPHGKPAD